MNSAMGTFTHPITLYSASGDQSETLEALVDTDMLFAVFPRAVLDRLGVVADRTARRRIGGRETVRSLGQVEAKLTDLRMPIVCVFSDDDEPARIGRHTLDTFLLEADFEKRQLVPKTFRLIQHI